jgi:hypothetical protein
MLPLLSLAALTRYCLPDQRVLSGHLKGLHPVINPGRHVLALAEVELQRCP